MFSYTFRGEVVAAEKYTQQVKEWSVRRERSVPPLPNILAEQEQLQQRLQADGEEQICALQRKFTDALQVQIPKTTGAEVKRLLAELKEERRAHGLLLGYAFASNAQHLEGEAFEGRTGGRRVQQLVVRQAEV
jgi:hypothetical protein